MGNRSIVIFANAAFSEFSPAVYLHWNGGPESIYPFLDELDRREVRGDQCYECARFMQIVGEFMDSTYRSNCSLGVYNGPKTIKEAAACSDDCGCDNGVFVVCREGKDRVVRRFAGYVQRGKMGHELSKAAVEKEREEAYAHRYNIGEDRIALSWGDKPTEAEYQANKQRA